MSMNFIIALKDEREKIEKQKKKSHRHNTGVIILETSRGF